MSTWWRPPGENVQRRTGCSTFFVSYSGLAKERKKGDSPRGVDIAIVQGSRARNEVKSRGLGPSSTGVRVEGGPRIDRVMSLRAKNRLILVTGLDPYFFGYSATCATTATQNPKINSGTATGATHVISFVIKEPVSYWPLYIT